VGRAIVLVACLIAAGVIAGYTHYSERIASQTPVYTVLVPQGPPESPAVTPAAPAIPPSQKAIATPGDRASLARELQRELKRVGCYGGEINGVWTTSSRMAMKAFTDQVNATLPIDNPDYILLSLVQQRQDTVCGTTTDAKAAPQPGEKTTTTIGAAVPAAAAVTALAAATPPAAPPPVAPKAEANVAPPPGDRPKLAAVPAETAPKTAQPDAAPRAGPVPPASVYGRRSNRYVNRNTARPPRFVRNFLRTLGFR
jgi:hypothetical protein